VQILDAIFTLVYRLGWLQQQMIHTHII